MKYCYHCGALLVESTASFCAECGKPLKTATINTEETAAKEEDMPASADPAPSITKTPTPVPPPAPAPVLKQTSGSKSPSGQQHGKNNNPSAAKPKTTPDRGRSVKTVSKQQPTFTKNRSVQKRPPDRNDMYRQPRQEQQRRPDPRDAHYDGYYDDVRPGDKGNTRERLDPEMIKRVILISCGALVLIIFSVVIMTML